MHHQPMRRQLLKMGLLAPVAGLTGGCSWYAHLFPPQPRPNPTSASARAIDIHCHIFNGADLPIRGFVEDVVLNLPDNALSIAPDALIELVSAVIKDQVIAPAKEAMLLRAGGGAHALSQPLDDDTLFRTRVTKAVQKLQTPPASEGGAHARQPGEKPIAPQTQDNLQKAFQHFGGVGRSKGMRAHGKPTQPQGTFTPDEVTAGIKAEGGVVYGVLWLGCLLTLNRLELAQRLASLPSQDSADVRLFVPAMIDFSYWVNDFSASSHADQIAVMTQIARVSAPKYPMHGWVSYCPWRQIHDDQQLARIQDAVMNGGLMGVKLYPPMGFYPTGNKDAADGGEVYPGELGQNPQYIQQLDDNLEALYQWCGSAGVPLLAHCSYSQYTSKQAGLRAAPDGWAKVLQRHPDLRLNIGHSGGLWSVAHSASNRPPGTPWTQRTLEILNDSKLQYVSADFADYSTMVEPGADNQQAFTETMTAVKGWLDPATHKLARSRLMYGTDWSMLSQIHPNDTSYYLAMKSQIPQQLGFTQAESDGFLGANAARLLGVSIQGGVKPQTRQRLEAFYKAHNLDPANLALWDPA